MNTAWVFPGQGSHFVGMGWDLCAEFAEANEILEAASKLSGFPLKTYCLQGPEDTLTRTDVLQPAMTAINVACIELPRAWPRPGRRGRPQPGRVRSSLRRRRPGFERHAPDRGGAR